MKGRVLSFATSKRASPVRWTSRVPSVGNCLGYSRRELALSVTCVPSSRMICVVVAGGVERVILPLLSEVMIASGTSRAAKISISCIVSSLIMRGTISAAGTTMAAAMPEVHICMMRLRFWASCREAKAFHAARVSSSEGKSPSASPKAFSNLRSSVSILKSFSFFSSIIGFLLSGSLLRARYAKLWIYVSLRCRD